ncbi:hypothetical protein GPECTOR_38g327 [Gonium pectorale]|uniref:Uncharacterized protein n=1 Tax=Gonium pectorale TaxID=33097 RepID=A0A150GCN6_GONPE|nr:hypothetical protein GPECTOR_38g327 [Gonium pectorale]|eukprot:KXZ47090.1 hypothetical protein GPECTOR_38g327 [Gonium pectorale]
MGPAAYSQDCLLRRWLRCLRLLPAAALDSLTSLLLLLLYEPALKYASAAHLTESLDPIMAVVAGIELEAPLATAAAEARQPLGQRLLRPGQPHQPPEQQLRQPHGLGRGDQHQEQGDRQAQAHAQGQGQGSAAEAVAGSAAAAAAAPAPAGGAPPVVHEAARAPAEAGESGGVSDVEMDMDEEELQEMLDEAAEGGTGEGAAAAGMAPLLAGEGGPEAGRLRLLLCGSLDRLLAQLYNVEETTLRWGWGRWVGGEGGI